MAVVYKHRKTFGGIEVVGSIDDKQVIIGNKIYPLSRILSVSYDSQRCVIRFCGTKEDLSHHTLEMVAIDLAKYKMTSKRIFDYDLTEHPVEMSRALARVSGGRFRIFNDSIYYDVVDGDPYEGYWLIKKHSRLDELDSLISAGFLRYPLRSIGKF